MRRHRARRRAAPLKPVCQARVFTKYRYASITYEHAYPCGKLARRKVLVPQPESIDPDTGEVVETITYRLRVCTECCRIAVINGLKEVE